MRERHHEQLKALLALGKDRGFLTHVEIIDHLPGDIVEPEIVENVISSLTEMGIAVYEHTPDAETLLLSDHAAASSADDEAEAVIEAALPATDQISAAPRTQRECICAAWAPPNCLLARVKSPLPNALKAA